MRERVSWWSTFVLLLAAIFLTWLITLFAVTRGKAEFAEGVARIAVHLAEDHRKANLLGAITSIAGIDPDIRATAQGRAAPDNPAVTAKLRYVFDKFGLDNMMVMAADGTVNAYMVKNVKTTITGKNFVWRPYFSGAIAGKPTMYAAFGSNSHERGFYVSAPIPAAADDAAPAGVIVAKQGFEEIDRRLAAEKFPLMVLSPEGVVFAANVPSWVYRVLGGPEELARAKEDKRVNNAYKAAAPVLIPLGAAGRIDKDGHALQMFAAGIDWPDPSGVWQVAGFVGDEDIFGWPARVLTATVIFMLLLLIHTWLRTRQRAQRKTEQVISLLDNSGEGFLSFGRDLRVDSEYSRACETMLDTVPAGREIAGLLFGEASSEARLMREIIASALAVEDAEVRDSMLSLLPKEVGRGERLLAVEYRRIGREKFMVILSDITAQRHMADLLELEQSHLKMVVLAVSDNRNFFETVDGFREFLTAEAATAAENQGVPAAQQVTKIRRLYREIHTYKGLLAQFSFPATPALLHAIESSLGAYLERAASNAPAAERPGVDFAQLEKTFAADLRILSDALGEDFLIQGYSLILSETQAERLEHLSMRLLRGEQIDTGIAEVRRLLDEIIRLRKLRLTDALHGYDRLLQQVAQRQEKAVLPLQVEDGEEIWIDPQHWKGFLQSLVHVFRNAVIHGLEDPETRWERDKEEAGRVSCRVRRGAGHLHLTIADDGAGLDLDALRSKAAAQGLAGAAQLDDAAAADLVFMDCISTQAAVTDLAGRGVGLAAVRQAVEALGGKVTVRSRAGAGTEFEFVLPFSDTGSLVDHG
ncbi:MAG: hypothetical protein H3C26_14940 [Rhodocyclaceae bacterium]|nr:hypothetical protein [Rhodocyclaceae bacterium]